MDREPFIGYSASVETYQSETVADAQILSVHLALLLTGEPPGVAVPKMSIHGALAAVISVYGVRSLPDAVSHLRTLANNLDRERMNGKKGI